MAAPGTPAEYERWVDEHVLETFRAPPLAEPLYHYTDERGLRGIIESRAIRATDYRDLADGAELRHADVPITNALVRLHGRYRDKLGKAVLARAARDYSRHNVSSHEAFNFHVACFCKSANQPALWERFGRGGYGYCLGFRPVGSGEPHIVPGVEPLLQYVEYDPEAQAEFVAKHARLMLARAEPLRRYQSVERSAYSGILRFAAFTALRTKAPNFADEQELRLLVWPRGRHSLPSNTTPPRWIAWPLRAGGKLPLLERVDIGHKHGADEVVRVRAFLEGAGYGTDGAPPVPDVSIATL